MSAGGWPLYYYASDGEPGDTTGQGGNDVWWVLGPDGTPNRSGYNAGYCSTASEPITHYPR